MCFVLIFSSEQWRASLITQVRVIEGQCPGHPIKPSSKVLQWLTRVEMTLLCLVRQLILIFGVKVFTLGRVATSKDFAV